MKLFSLFLLISVTGLQAAIVPAESRWPTRNHPVRRFGNQVVDFRAWFNSQVVAPPTNVFLLEGEILQVVGGGLLVDVSLNIPGFYSGTKIVMLENYPQTPEAFDGKTVECVVKPSGRYQYRTTSGAESTVEKYDHGIPLTREEIAILDVQKLETIRARNEVLAQAEQARVKAMTPRVVAYQQQQASNGAASFQLELGKRYMRGDGVETNLTIALHWLQAACTNGESQASNLLQQLKSNGTK